MRQYNLKWDEKNFFANEDNWAYGPVLEIICRFRQRFSDEEVARVIFADEAVSGPYERIQQLIEGKIDSVRGWKGVTKSCLLLLKSGVVGANVLFKRADASDILLFWIPPRHVERLSPGYPWRTFGQWIDRSVLTLHESIIDFIRRIHRSLPLKNAIIEDETWLMDRGEDFQGILVHGDFAKPPGYLGAKMYGEFAIVDLVEVKE